MRILLNWVYRKIRAHKLNILIYRCNQGEQLSKRETQIMELLAKEESLDLPTA